MYRERKEKKLTDKNKSKQNYSKCNRVNALVEPLQKSQLLGSWNLFQELSGKPERILFCRWVLLDWESTDLQNPDRWKMNINHFYLFYRLKWVSFVFWTLATYKEWVSVGIPLRDSRSEKTSVIAFKQEPSNSVLSLLFVLESWKRTKQNLTFQNMCMFTGYGNVHGYWNLILRYFHLGCLFHKHD